MNEILDIAIQIINKVPAVLPHLSNKARYIYGTSNPIGYVYGKSTQFDYKTYDFFRARVDGLVRGVYDNNLGGNFIDIMANLISGQLTQAYQQAYEDEGYTDFVLPDYLAASLQAMILNQFTFVDQFFRDIVDARIDGTPIEPLLVRSGMWANRYNEAYNEALRLITVNNGGNLIWTLGEAEHCTTCLALNGIVASGKEWEASGWKPQSEDLECHGYNCKCQLLPTSNRRSKNAAERLAAI